MASFGIADDEQLAALAKLLDDYPKEHGIKGDAAARDLGGAHHAIVTGGLMKPEDIRRVLDFNPTPLVIDQTAA